MTSPEKYEINECLLDFLLYAERRMPSEINNALNILKYVPKDIKNPVLLFLLQPALDHFVETFVLEVEQAWRIINKELKKFNMKELDKYDQDYSDLKIIRDKFLGHRVEVSLSTLKYQKWYKETYGSYEKIFGLVKTVSQKICKKIEELISTNQLGFATGTVKVPIELKKEDIDNLLLALKKSAVY